MLAAAGDAIRIVRCGSRKALLLGGQKRALTDYAERTKLNRFNVLRDNRM